MSTYPTQVTSNPLGLYFLLSRSLPGLTLLSAISIFLPRGPFPGIVLSTSTIIAILLSFPAGQLVYTVATSVERVYSGEEYHRRAFEDMISGEEGGRISAELLMRYLQVFEEVYDLQRDEITPSEMYRITRSAIELDNRGRSLQWDAIQSFSRSMKYAILLAGIIILLGPIVGRVIEPLYYPIILSLTNMQIALLEVILLSIAIIFHYGEKFYKRGYVQYMIADFYNLYASSEMQNEH